MGWISRNYRGRLRHEFKIMPVFHAGRKDLRPEDFDFEMANKNSDFGKAAYFSFSHGLANIWAKKKGKHVNTYQFNYEDARTDPSIRMKELTDPLEWLNTILEIYENGGYSPYDIIIGDIMDGDTSTIIRRYQNRSKAMGIRMSEFPDAIKLRMIEELNPKKTGLQVAFRNKESLRFLEFIDCTEVRDVDIPDVMDPADAAGLVCTLMADKLGISFNEAMVGFLHSATFRRMRADDSLCYLDPEELMAMYLEELRRDDGFPTVSRKRISGHEGRHNHGIFGGISHSFR